MHENIIQQYVFAVLCTFSYVMDDCSYILLCYIDYQSAVYLIASHNYHQKAIS